MGIGQTPWTQLQKKSTRAIEQDRKDVVQQRQIWHECQESVDPERLVFVDETGLKTDMNRVRGWAEAGCRLVDRAVGGHWETNTLVHAIAIDGTRAAMILDGPLDGISFAGFCEQLLSPALQPGDLVVLDNLSSHKSAAAAQSIESVGARLVFLPPYSPDLNPIENIFSKLKQLVRGIRPKTWTQIIEAAKQAMQQISLSDICNAMYHAGYAAT